MLGPVSDPMFKVVEGASMLESVLPVYLTDVIVRWDGSHGSTPACPCESIIP